MKKTTPVKKPRTIGQKLGITVVCVFFATTFGIGGAFGIGGLVYQAYGWYRTSSWQPTMAEVTKAELRSSRGSRSTTYRVVAQYRYVIENIEYTGTRIGYGDDTADNIGDWHEERFAELDEARRNGRRVLAWYDPKHPTEAVIDRDVRWGLLLFLVPFAGLFSGVSIGALWVLVGTWRSK